MLNQIEITEETEVIMKKKTKKHVKKTTARPPQGKIPGEGCKPSI